ncbi:hypothetical protein R4K89_09805 [Brachyspira intermedia]|uniref:hypothetical protein n=1 Tax=Brachyspira intermedia TaxID=84377 RepID=UPI0030045069
MAFVSCPNLITVMYYGTSQSTINNNNVLSECLKLKIIPNAENEKDTKLENFLGSKFTNIRKQ